MDSFQVNNCLTMTPPQFNQTPVLSSKIATNSKLGRLLTMNNSQSVGLGEVEN